MVIRSMVTRDMPTKKDMVTRNMATRDMATRRRTVTRRTAGRDMVTVRDMVTKNMVATEATADIVEIMDTAASAAEDMAARDMLMMVRDMATRRSMVTRCVAMRDMVMTVR